MGTHYSNPRTSALSRRRAAREGEARAWREQPGSIERTPDGLTYRPPADPVLALLTLRQLRAELLEIETGLVRAARAAGHSWYEVGCYLGLTSEGTRQRHGERNAYRERRNSGP